MLWLKGWLETRLRLLFVLVMIVFTMAVQHPVSVMSPSARSKAAILTVLALSTGVDILLACSMLAGAGIDTQPSFQAAKGLHGSTLFTLSLPVSRLRLLATRAAVGWFEAVVLIAVLCCGDWLEFPLLRSITTPREMLEYAATLVVSTSAPYCLSVLLATFLGDQWRTWGTMMGALALWWLSFRHWLPASIDIVRAIGKGSPLIAHSIPWSAMAFSIVLAAIFFVAALKVAQTREY
jgi:hypothetical protein